LDDADSVPVNDAYVVAVDGVLPWCLPARAGVFGSVRNTGTGVLLMDSRSTQRKPDRGYRRGSQTNRYLVHHDGHFSFHEHPSL
jgi:hypothetical protein